MRMALYKPLRVEKERKRIEGESTWADLEGMEFKDRFYFSFLKRF
jgi:hypothetical protein